MVVAFLPSEGRGRKILSTRLKTCKNLLYERSYVNKTDRCSSFQCPVVRPYRRQSRNKVYPGGRRPGRVQCCLRQSGRKSLCNPDPGSGRKPIVSECIYG